MASIGGFLTVNKCFGSATSLSAPSEARRLMLGVWYFEISKKYSGAVRRAGRASCSAQPLEPRSCPASNERGRRGRLLRDGFAQKGGHA